MKQHCQLHLKTSKAKSEWQRKSSGFHVGLLRVPWGLATSQLIVYNWVPSLYIEPFWTTSVRLHFPACALGCDFSSKLLLCLLCSSPVETFNSTFECYEIVISDALAHHKRLLRCSICSEWNILWKNEIYGIRASLYPLPVVLSMFLSVSISFLPSANSPRPPPSHSHTECGQTLWQLIKAAPHVFIHPLAIF